MSCKIINYLIVIDCSLYHRFKEFRNLVSEFKWLQGKRFDRVIGSVAIPQDLNMQVLVNLNTLGKVSDSFGA
jgi:hypothetical protein